MPVVNIGTFTLEQEDSAGASVINRTAGPISYTGVAGEFRSGVLTSTSPATISLPTSPATQFYLKNLHTSDPISVVWTPQGGTSAVALNVYPKGILGHWTTSTGAAAGITALILTTSSTGASVPYEYFAGG